MTEVNKDSKRKKFTTTLRRDRLKKLGVLAAMIGADKNDVIEIIINEIDTEEWTKNHEVEKTRRDIQ